VLGLAVGVTACGDLFGPSHRYGAVEVRVEDTAGSPVSGVGLTLYTGERHMGYGATDADGRHTFSFVPPGGYGVHASVPEGWGVPDGGANFVVFDMEEGQRREVTVVLMNAGAVENR
jgi:hypothetical protein